MRFNPLSSSDPQYKRDLGSAKYISSLQWTIAPGVRSSPRPPLFRRKNTFFSFVYSFVLFFSSRTFRFRKPVLLAPVKRKDTFFPLKVPVYSTTFRTGEKTTPTHVVVFLTVKIVGISAWKKKWSGGDETQPPAVSCNFFICTTGGSTTKKMVPKHLLYGSP